MRVPRLRWDRRFNVASLDVSFTHRIYDLRDHGDILLGYAATGRLARVVFLDPRRQLPLAAKPVDAARAALRLLSPHAGLERELGVLRSVLERTEVRPRPLAEGA